MRIILLLLLFTSSIYAQEDKKEVQPFAVIENVPIYPGCESGDNEERKKCMSDKVSRFVSERFKIKKASRGLDDGVDIHRIFVSFKIDKKGNVTDIVSRAPNDALEKEAIRVIKKLPKMKPGIHNGKTVGVMYSLPITFKIETDDKKI